MLPGLVISVKTLFSVLFCVSCSAAVQGVGAARSLRPPLGEARGVQNRLPGRGPNALPSALQGAVCCRPGRDSALNARTGPVPAGLILRNLILWLHYCTDPGAAAPWRFWCWKHVDYCRTADSHRADWAIHVRATDSSWNSGFYTENPVSCTDC